MASIIAVFVVAFAALCAAQRPSPCFSPSMWEGHVFLVLILLFDLGYLIWESSQEQVDSSRQEAVEIQGYYAYDAVNLRKFRLEEFDEFTPTNHTRRVACDLFDLTHSASPDSRAVHASKLHISIAINLQGVYYEYDLDTKVCVKGRLNFSFWYNSVGTDRVAHTLTCASPECLF